MTYRDYFFPGTLVLILLFTAIFTTISIIEDRREGFLQSVLVAPIPRWSMVLGKLLGGTLIAWLQGCCSWAWPEWRLRAGLGPGERPGRWRSHLFVALVRAHRAGVRAGLADGLDAGLSRGDERLLLMPMWLLSGAFFPAESAACWAGSCGSIR